MGWEVGNDDNYGRDIGYGVPAICDHPGCNKQIDRGIVFVCGGDISGGEHGCGLFFCDDHLFWYEGKKGPLCERCSEDMDPFEPKPDTKEWVSHKLTDESWGKWRENNPEKVRQLIEYIGEQE